MSREWKPGDVALVEDRDAERCIAVRTWKDSWATAENFGEIKGAWPLVVLDPEDREAVCRLRDLLDPAKTGFPVAAYQAALRELADPTPTRPDEPTGLGAVVEDAEGRTWVRHDNTPGAFPWVRGGCGVLGWSEIAAVRVLSEGIS